MPPADRPATIFDRIHRSFIPSVGSIVFGMEDGTVWVFGLVFGVAVSPPDSHAASCRRWPAPSASPQRRRCPASG